MNRELKKFICECGQEYYSDHGTPQGMSWTSGHTCIPIETQEDFT
jgi:hypothetical protein